MAGIIKEMEKYNTVVFDEISDKDLKLCFEKIIDNINKSKKQKIKDYKGNMNHLYKKSKQLKKNIPSEVLYMCNPYFNIGLYVSSSFYEKYKEWF